MKKILTSFIGIASIGLNACDTLKDLTTASNNKPVINSFDHNPKEINNKDEKIIFTVVASDRDKKDTLEYKWSSTKGTLSTNTGETVNWSPLKSNGDCDFQSSEGIAVISVLVSDGNGGTANAQTSIRIKKGCENGGVVSTSTTSSPAPQTTPTPTSIPTQVPVVPSVTPTSTVIQTPIPSPISTILVTPTAVATLPNPSPVVSIIPTPSQEYKPPVISFQSLEIKENYGNSDNVPNRGEDLDIYATFVNTGGVSSNYLNINMSTTSSFAKIIDDSTSIEALKPNAPKETSGSFRIVLDKTVTPNTEIPLTFKLKDTFGNEYTTTGSFIVR
ncbi:MAG: hypothetical protein U0354_14890 [Candidatus Sericytochromatia bacterium]